MLALAYAAPCDSDCRVHETVTGGSTVEPGTVTIILGPDTEQPLASLVAATDAGDVALVPLDLDGVNQLLTTLLRVQAALVVA